MKNHSKDYVKILFDLVYRWGEAGFKADYTNKSFRDIFEKARKQTSSSVNIEPKADGW